MFDHCQFPPAGFIDGVGHQSHTAQELVVGFIILNELVKEKTLQLLLNGGLAAGLFRYGRHDRPQRASVPVPLLGFLEYVRQVGAVGVNGHSVRGAGQHHFINKE